MKDNSLKISASSVELFKKEADLMFKFTAHHLGRELTNADKEKVHKAASRGFIGRYILLYDKIQIGLIIHTLEDKSNPNLITITIEPK